MMIKNILFSELKKMLFQLNFTLLSTQGSHYLFQHSVLGTLIVLPEYQNNTYVDLTHLVAVRRILLEHGLIDPIVFDNFQDKNAQLTKY